MASKKAVPAKQKPEKSAGSRQQLTVKSFGPLADCVLPVPGLIVLIGEQASGKSTLAKLLNFFQSVPALVEEHAAQLAAGPPFESWVKLMRQRFMDSFGTTKHMPSFDIEYRYGEDVRLAVSQKKGARYVHIEPDARLREAIVGHAKAVSHPVMKRTPDGRLLAEDAVQRLTRRTLDELTHCEAERIFVPAARSLLSVLSADLLFADLPSLDPLMRQFVRRIARLQRDFTRSLEDQIDVALHATLREAPVDVPAVTKAMNLVKSVLKGQYVYDGGKERISLDSGGDVYLRFASSGQQEALWILLLLFSIILNSKPASVIMEEPEAHLFPFAQRDVIHLLALCKNAKPAPGAPPNSAVLTTHSPYVLAALNNLLYAWQVGTRNAAAGEKAARVIDRRLWLDPADTGVWFVEGGTIRSIMDLELGLIQAEEIDGVSSALRGDFDALAELEGL